MKDLSKIILKSIRTKKLTNIQIKLICKLKDTQWKSFPKSQLEWFKINSKKNDLNLLLIIKKKLIGYILLRKRHAITNNKTIIYYNFDTVIIQKKFRKHGLGKILILFHNKIMTKLKKHSFLICQKKLVPFYLKLNWKVKPKKSYKIMDHKSSLNKKKLNLFGMTYKIEKKIKNKIYYYFN